MSSVTACEAGHARERSPYAGRAAATARRPTAALRGSPGRVRLRTSPGCGRVADRRYGAAPEAGRRAGAGQRTARWTGGAYGCMADSLDGWMAELAVVAAAVELWP